MATVNIRQYVVEKEREHSAAMIFGIFHSYGAPRGIVGVGMEEMRKK